MGRRRSRDLQFENDLVLNLVQALLGAISPNVIAVSLEADRSSATATLHVALVAWDEADREEFEDAVPDVLDASGSGVRRHHVVFTVLGDDELSTWDGWHHRWVFGRKA